MQSVAGAPGVDGLLERLLQDDAAAESELTAIHLFRSQRSETEVEIGPETSRTGRFIYSSCSINLRRWVTGISQ